MQHTDVVCATKHVRCKKDSMVDLKSTLCDTPIAAASLVVIFVDPRRAHKIQHFGYTSKYQLYKFHASQNPTLYLLHNMSKLTEQEIIHCHDIQRTAKSGPTHAQGYHCKATANRDSDLTGQRRSCSNLKASVSGECYKVGCRTQHSYHR